MYKAIKDKFKIINQREVAKKVGINECVLSRIINGHQTTKKTTAKKTVTKKADATKLEENKVKWYKHPIFVGVVTVVLCYFAGYIVGYLLAGIFG